MLDGGRGEGRAVFFSAETLQNSVKHAVIKKFKNT